MLGQLTVGAIFAIAAAAKWTHPMATSNTVRGYGLLPDALAAPGGVVLVVAEAGLAVTLLGGIATTSALYAASVVLAMFAVLLVVTILRRGTIECGCLGQVLELRLGWPSVVMNAGLAVVAVLAAESAHLSSAPFSTYLALGLTAVLLALMYWLVTYAFSVAGLVDESIARPKGTYT